MSAAARFAPRHPPERDTARAMSQENVEIVRGIWEAFARFAVPCRKGMPPRYPEQSATFSCDIARAVSRSGGCRGEDLSDSPPSQSECDPQRGAPPPRAMLPSRSRVVQGCYPDPVIGPGG